MMRIFSLFFLAFFLTLAGCRQSADAFYVVVLVAGNVDDAGMNQSVRDALLKIQQEQGEDRFEFSIVENVTADQAADVLRREAAESADVIIAHGPDYRATLQQVAPEFPGVVFAWGLGDSTMGVDNLSVYRVRSEEAGYVNGVLAATLVEDMPIGLIIAQDTADAPAYIAGFTNGVRVTDANLTVHTRQARDGGDNAVMQLAGEGVRVLTAVGADLSALRLAEEQDMRWLGVQADQRDVAPDAVIISQVYDWSVAFDEIFAAVQDGASGGQVWELRFENSGILARYNQKTPAILRQIGDEAMFDVIDGLVAPIP